MKEQLHCKWFSMRSSHERPAWADTPIVGREYLKEVSRCMIECAFDIGIHHPWAGGVRPCQTEHFFDGVVTSSTRAKPVTDPFEASFPKRFQGVFHHGLDTAIDNGGNAKRTFAVPLGEIDPT